MSYYCNEALLKSRKQVIWEKTIRRYIQIYITIIIQAQILCKMKIPFIHIALIKMLHANILVSSVTHTCTELYVYFLYLHILYQLSQPQCMHSKRIVLTGNYTLCNVTELVF